ncbi:hypothetical protein DCAR_0100948 [Daucus carota subsp. sativus]|uniref:Uncharacterized protein n=1 Tax=Daucus carota subsp. sativus TaxID=79200 RepID=A0A166G222_DAUCS|nr:hypothetical protein DCAR_0100948 [Daucus carota subsp. sativus]
MVHGNGRANGRPLEASHSALNVVKAGKANELCGKESTTECKGKHKRDAREEEARHVFENQDYIYTQSIP